MSSTSIGLYVSSGGYRAATFHLGTLLKLQKMEILSQISVISTISGGSLTRAALPFASRREADIARKVGTNLTPFKLSEIQALMKQGSALTEIHIKLHCSTLIK